MSRSVAFGPLPKSRQIIKPPLPLLSVYATTTPSSPPPFRTFSALKARALALAVLWRVRFFTGRVPGAGAQGHVLILGGACDKNAVVVLRLFLEELLNPARGVELPEVVLLCFSEADEEMLKFLKEPANTELVTFLRGKSLLTRDLRRARADRAAMCFVLADIFTSTPDYEDQHNILNSTLLIKNYPRLPLRLMLLRPENRTLVRAVP